MLHSIGQDPEGKRLDCGQRIVARVSVRRCAGEIDDVGQPAAVLFALELDVKSPSMGAWQTCR